MLSYSRIKSSHSTNIVRPCIAVIRISYLIFEAFESVTMYGEIFNTLVESPVELTFIISFAL